MYKIFTYKRPLIVIVVPWKLSNRQNGFENFKYVVILNPLLTAHVTQSMHSELLAYNMG